MLHASLRLLFALVESETREIEKPSRGPRQRLHPRPKFAPKFRLPLDDARINGRTVGATSARAARVGPASLELRPVLAPAGRVELREIIVEKRHGWCAGQEPAADRSLKATRRVPFSARFPSCALGCRLDVSAICRPASGDVHQVERACRCRQPSSKFRFHRSFYDLVDELDGDHGSPVCPLVENDRDTARIDDDGRNAIQARQRAPVPGFGKFAVRVLGPPQK